MALDRTDTHAAQTVAGNDDVEALRRGAAFVQASPDAAIGVTRDGVINDWNRSAERLYGYSTEEALGMPIEMLVAPELRASSAEWIARAQTGASVSQYETQRMAKDGRRIDVSISVAPVRNERGETIGAAGFTRDITVRVLAENRLRTSEAQLAEAQELAAVGSWEWDPITDETQWSAGMYRIFGVDPETFAPSFESFFGLVHPDDVPGLRELAGAAIANAAVVRHTHRIVRPDGVERFTETRARAIVGDAGNVVRMVGTIQDITDTVRARQRLDEVSRYNETLLNSAGDGICGLSVDGSVTFANPAALRATGLTLDELEGCDLHATLQHTRPDGTPYAAQDSPILASLHDGQVHRCDRDVFWRKDGTSFPVEYTSTPLLASGASTGAMVIFKDISERREVERVKDELTSVVSHELRTPLASIRGSLGLLQSGALRASPEKAQRMIEIAVQNTDRVVRLINDILDVESIGSGTIRMNAVSCDAAHLIEQAVDGLASMADEAGVTLVTRKEPVTIVADADRIVQTLTNLISNAIKFSEAGMSVGIAVEARNGEVRFDVSDEGRGIPPDKLETIFGRFEQVDASDSREKGGTGLGLAICRAIVELHGGRIWARSRPGAGAVVSFTLPA